MKVMATPDSDAKPCFSGVLIRIPAYTRGGLAYAESWYFGRARVIFSSTGPRQIWSPARLFILVEYFSRECAGSNGVAGDYTTYHPTPEELALPTR